ncbi:MAG: adenylyltransferase/cytidyltransferase family protein, partial [Vicinamibacterales bacterium]
MTQPPPSAIEHLSRVKAGPHVVTIGNFDGVHRGHQYLIHRVIDEAQSRGVRSLVVTFEPHPTAVLRPGQPFVRLTTPAVKLARIAETGIDEIVVIPFDLEFAALEPREFLALLVDTV